MFQPADEKLIRRVNKFPQISLSTMNSFITKQLKKRGCVRLRRRGGERRERDGEKFKNTSMISGHKNRWERLLG